MALQTTHELHKRRFGRNLGLALVLAGFVALVFALTIVKIQRGDEMEGYDHQLRPELVPAEAAPAAATPAVPAPAATAPTEPVPAETAPAAAAGTSP